MVYGAFAVPGAFWVGLHAFLPGGEKALLGFGALSIALLCLGTMIWVNDDLNKNLIVAAAAPLAAFALYGLLIKVFGARFGHAPADVAFNFKQGLFWDRVFAFAVTLGLIFGTTAAFIIFGILKGSA